MTRKNMTGLLRRLIAVGLFITLLPAPPASAMTVGEERELGEKLLYMVRKEFHVLDDPDISSYINGLGQEILGIIGPQNFDYHFFIVASDQFNAFAAPSGLIFFYTGLIETMKNEDELVSVLAHEIGHVVNRHIARRMEKDTTITMATMAMAMASLAVGNPALTQGLFTGSLAAGQAMSLKYSRIDEEEADRLAFGWMKESGRNPEAMQGMLSTMRRVARYRSEQLPQYLLTHPNPEARLEYVQSLLAMDPEVVAQARQKKRDDFAFLRMKYRVMAEISDPEKMRAGLAGIVAGGKDPEQTMMARYGLALLSSKELAHEQALTELAKVQAHYPDRPILLVDEAVIRLNMGDMNKAGELLRQALRHNPHDLYASFHLALLHARMGKLDEAEVLFSQIKAAMPEYSRVYYEIGHLYSQRGQNGVSFYYLGKYYLLEGKIKLAKQYLKKVGDDPAVELRYREEAMALLKRLEELEKAG